ncbi:MAG TPA: hypothetical protein VJ895_01520 [Candidatus Nanoarchaeia archaeon]|nr:hypothetical protein [Candidatus Nanoarchaeia archaeon]
MEEEIRRYDFECVRIKKGIEKEYRFIFSSDFGEYHLELDEEDYDLFRPGHKYGGVVRVRGIPDFIGEEDKMENICTVSYNLEKLLQNEIVVWENKRQKK